MDVGSLVQHSQYAVPVGIVLVCVVLVFVFGFKKAEQPPFAQLSSGSDVDRKLASKKRGKPKEKRATNGQISNDKASPTKKTSVKTDASKKGVPKGDDVNGKLNERKQDENKMAAPKKEKNQILTKSGKENKVEQAKNKKNLKNFVQEKPVDFDDGDWEQAYSRKDKKNKKKEDDTPSKKNKKSINKKTELITETVAKQKELEKPEIKDKLAKDTENKVLKEKDNKEVILTPISNDDVTSEKEGAKEASKEDEKNKMKKVEKEEKKKDGKSKKAKKASEEETTPASVPSTPKADNKSREKIVPVDNIEKIASDSIQEKAQPVGDKNVPVFDELGDVWTEAKPQKKSKKKARKDN